MILDYKSYFGGLKDLDMSKRRVSGYLSAFGNKDFDGDVIVKGAYEKTLKERKSDIFFLNQHNWSQPHGKFQELTEDEKGLYFVSDALPDTTYSNDTLKLYEAGIVKEHSVGFVTVKDEIKSDARYIKEIKLYEGSNVTLGANNRTPFTGMKSGIKEINEQSALLIKAIRNGTFTDETFILLEVALKQLQREAYELGKKSLIEPLDDTQIIEPINKEVLILNEYLKKWN
jgi:HK97 family phage prohead protease